MKTTNSFRLFAVAAVFAAIVMGGCMAQPNQQCQIAQPSSAIQGLPQFWVKYELVSGTGACSTLTGDEIGFQTYTNPKDDNDVKVAIRASRLGSWYNGDVDPVPRVDSTDPDGKKINAVVKLTAFPDAKYVCKADGAIPEAVQNFDEETFDVDLDDGGTESQTLPAITVKYKWSDAQWISSPSIPGQVFAANLEYTEGTCVATYKTKGIWPVTSCTTNADCSPQPLPEAKVCDPTAGTCPNDQITDPTRHIIGSGLNPDLKVECDPDNGTCVMSNTFDDVVAGTK